MFHVEHLQLSRHKVSRETFENNAQIYAEHESRLELYINQLLWWNKRINLVSRSASKKELKEHLRHSLLPLSFNWWNPYHLPIVDTGTGGGLPGIPLAIADKNHTYTLNDIVQKKMLGVEQIIHQLKLQNAKTFSGSIEEYRTEDPFILISKHAFKIPDLLSLISHLPWEEIILYKGADLQEEVQDMTTDYAVKIYELEYGTDHDFYRGKVLVRILK